MRLFLYDNIIYWNINLHYFPGVFPQSLSWGRERAFVILCLWSVGWTNSRNSVEANIFLIFSKTLISSKLSPKEGKAAGNLLQGRRKSGRDFFKEGRVNGCLSDSVRRNFDITHCSAWRRGHIAERKATWSLWGVESQTLGSPFVQKYSTDNTKVSGIIMKLGHWAASCKQMTRKGSWLLMVNKVLDNCHKPREQTYEECLKLEFSS